MSSTHDSQTRTLGSKLDSVSENAEQMKERFRERAEELLEEGQERLNGVKERIAGTVREHPLSTLLAAGGVGLLLGLLISRRQH